MNRLARAFCGIGVAAMVMCAPAAESGAEEKNPYESTPEIVAEGRELFLSGGCYACHGTQATGRGRLGPNLTNLKKTDGELHELLMKTFKGKVTSEEIWKIMTYLRSLAEP